jgi:hypothetical protein
MTYHSEFLIKNNYLAMLVYYHVAGPWEPVTVTSLLRGEVTVTGTTWGQIFTW